MVDEECEIDVDDYTSISAVAIEDDVFAIISVSVQSADGEAFADMSIEQGIRFRAALDRALAQAQANQERKTIL